jgi:hypothetical protein
VRYVDDIRVIINAMRVEWRWWVGVLSYCEIWRQEDEIAGYSSTTRTLTQEMFKRLLHRSRKV